MNDVALEPGDGASTEAAGPVRVHATSAAEALLFDLG